RIDGTPASRVHSEHHRETAGKNAELRPQQGPGKCQAFPSGQHSPGAFGPSKGSDRIGGSRLAHAASQFGGVAVRWRDKHADESPRRRRGPRALVSISLSPIGATRAPRRGTRPRVALTLSSLADCKRERLAWRSVRGR